MSKSLKCSICGNVELELFEMGYTCSICGDGNMVTTDLADEKTLSYIIKKVQKVCVSNDNYKFFDSDEIQKLLNLIEAKDSIIRDLQLSIDSAPRKIAKAMFTTEYVGRAECGHHVCNYYKFCPNCGAALEWVK